MTVALLAPVLGVTSVGSPPDAWAREAGQPSSDAADALLGDHPEGVAPSAELAAGALALTAELEDVDGRLLELEAEHRRARAAAADALLTAANAHAAREASHDDLRTYAVAAYVAGGRIPDSVRQQLLGAARHDADVEGTLHLLATVHDQLVGAVVDADRTVATAGQHVATTAAAEHALAAQVDELQQHRSTLAAQRAELVAAAHRAREEEDRALAELIAREAELRAGVPPAQPVATGVVPPRTVPDEVMAALGGIIPPTSLDAYWRAAALAAARAPGCGIDWALIAGVGAVESRHGTYRGGWPNPDGTVFPALIGIPLDGTRGTALIRDTDGGLYDGDPVYDRAVGPMQFIPGTWVRWAVDGNGDGIADPHNIYDATFAAALYLCSRAGGPITDPEATRRAVLGYNRSWHYVGLVLANAATYRALAPVTQPLEDETPDAADVAAVVPAPGDVTDAVRPGDGATSTTTPSGESTTTSTTRPDVPDEADPPREPG